MSRIEAAYEESDQRKYWVPCPTCREFQILKFAQLRWPKGDPQSAVYVCEHCGQEIQQPPEAVDAGARRVARAARRAMARRRASTSPACTVRSAGSRGATPPSSSSRRRRTPRCSRSSSTPCWARRGRCSAKRRSGRSSTTGARTYKIGTVPRGGLFLTAGADVQKDRIEVEIAAWGRGKESWSVDYRVFEGDTSRPQVWEKLTGLLNETFTTAVRPGIADHATRRGFRASPPSRCTSGRGGRAGACW